ncbi:MAG TPA: B12-binding domain-containing radical SAM protein, partial [Verrucomicrobiae bacterium]|nr:B12-binding domain-containing radical SAM protein [Verrucomicrobiae bacterium]
MLPSKFTGTEPLHSWSFLPRRRRRVLLVFPHYSHSFGTFNHAFGLAGVRAFMPPQGLLLVASLLPREWECKFVDENITPASPEDFDWADAVFISGMHIQRAAIGDIT